MYKNLFYFSLLLVYKSKTLYLRFTNYKSRYTQEKNCFRLKMLKAISFFFLQSRISLHPSRMIDPTTVDLSGSVRNAISVCCCLSFHPCPLLLFSPFLFFLILSILVYILVSSLFVSYIFLINVKYLVVQGLREIIGKLLHRMLGDLNFASR